MTNRLAQLLELIESPCQITVTAPPQLSLVITLLVSWAGALCAHHPVRLAGQVRLGGLVSWTVMVWAQVALLPRSEERRVGKVRRYRLAQLLELNESPCQVTVNVPPQL